VATYPIHVIRRDARIERLGEWRHEARVLVLEAPGFPLLGRGLHRLEGDLPWVFWDMCPSGYMGRALAERVPSLRLPPNPQWWSAEDCLRVLSEWGADLPGNLVVGDRPLARVRERLAAIDPLDDGRESVDLAGLEVSIGGGSSVGGDRPKFIVRRRNGADLLLKVGPPVDTSMGLRWRDLFALESHCAATLADHGHPAARSTLTRLVDVRAGGERAVLEIARFDRLPGGGRVSATTLAWLAADRQLADRAAPEVVGRLEEEGLVSGECAARVARQHAFSLAIGNTDAHLGNYGLLFDDEGRAALAPAFDVLPMALAPARDELPDVRLVPRSEPIDPSVAHLVDDLVRRVARDERISDEFKSLWRRFIGR
jgi:hypothetical protein